jgi:membrane fusion protein (multidrug efflux system)
MAEKTPASEPSAPPNTQAAAAAPSPRQRKARWPLLIAGPVVVLAVGGYIYLNSGRIAETDNAYIKADTVIVSPAVAGIVTRVAVAENQPVRTGDILFEIDQENYRLDRDRAKAQLEAVTSFIEGVAASYRQAMAELSLAQTDVRYARREVEREQSLTERGLGSESDLDDSQHRLDTATQKIEIIEQRLAQLRAQLGGNPQPTIEHHAAYRTAKAALDYAESEFARTTVRSPINGIVSHVPLAGGYAAPGTPIMSVISTDTFWVEANFKETQLAHVAVGQPAVIHVDTYGGQDWHGVVESISPATGAEFSVIPAQNASGNWVKVAQRIPVRIRLDPARSKPTEQILRAGMSAVVEIDTGFEREAPLFLGFLQHSNPN